VDVRVLFAMRKANVDSTLPPTANRRRSRILRYNGVESMISGRIGDLLALLALVCVLTIFLFPAIEGPYSVVHGPASALLAVRAAAKVRTAIAGAASRSVDVLTSPLVALCRMLVVEPDIHVPALPERSAILRC
jgi:hypothetical protein